MKTKTVILGGGLSGLYAAVLLERQGVDFVLLEARDRLGGRILSEVVPAGLLSADPGAVMAYDLGPSWFWPAFQPRVRQLVEDLEIGVFPQPTLGQSTFEGEDGQISRFPGDTAEPRSFRMQGGVVQLIECLAKDVPENKVHLSMAVQRVQAVPGGAVVEARDAQGTVQIFEANQVIIAAPPRLMARSIDFDPALPDPVRRTLLDVPTWMAGHAKVLALYEEPVWRKSGFSGQAFSHLGPLAEIHDASPAEGGPFALFGFVGLSAMARKAAGRTLLEESVFQLERFFGPGMLSPLRVLTKDWSGDPWTATVDDFTPLLEHPTYGLPESVRALWEGRLQFSSTEVSVRNGGYLEGALEGALLAVEEVLARSA
jgi:monoamine oxidase